MVLRVLALQLLLYAGKVLTVGCPAGLEAFFGVDKLLTFRLPVG